ncbi:MAG: hypothetical protein JO222_00410 [Frankiales bacterium]|nr:hypothetical protein [Frankiales bacterium]
MTTTPTRPRLRLLPPPPLDPPYDDERGPNAPVMDGTLALAFPQPVDTVPLRLVPPAAGPAHGAPAVDARQWTRRLAQAVIEVLVGARSAAQLSRYATFDVLQLLERSTGRLAARRSGPVTRPVVASVHVCEPRPGVAEGCAVIDTGNRRRALALRLESRNGQWQCTAIQIC